MKLCLYVYCNSLDKMIKSVIGRSNSVLEALRQDHLNDVYSNALSIVIAILASKIKKVWFFDPLGALFISLMILIGWISRGREQIDQLVGKSASSEIIGQLAYIAMKFHPKILAVDTVIAYHCGANIIAEVHILLPEDMPLRDAHEIGQGLEDKLETLPIVERAYVHLDVDVDHKPEHVVKIVD